MGGVAGMVPVFIFFGVHFWEYFKEVLGVFLGSKTGPKLVQKVLKNNFIFQFFFSAILELTGGLLGSILDLGSSSWKLGRPRSGYCLLVLSLRLCGSWELFKAPRLPSRLVLARFRCQNGPQSNSKSHAKTVEKLVQK